MFIEELRRYLENIENSSVEEFPARLIASVYLEWPNLSSNKLSIWSQKFLIGISNVYAMEAPDAEAFENTTKWLFEGSLKIWIVKEMPNIRRTGPYFGSHIIVMKTELNSPSEDQLGRLIDQTVGKVFDYMGIAHDLFRRRDGERLEDRSRNAVERRRLSVLKPGDFVS